ncbi:MAG: TetR/AcrR family transcriptional regulator [Prevotellaceae bacterium]|jgi:AcrR family transcriptional regulator|nr:TetR/AcrR family transcriptional regulator [Prevotellaceae bacterium]
MNNNDISTEQIILEAAEAEFLDKGFGNAKMMAIAQRAGVSHSMLHYYFRKKENLFQMIFRQKVQSLSQIFEEIGRQHLSFFDMIRLVVECQFDFVARNPKLPLFVLNEIVSKKENLDLLLDIVRPKLTEIFERMEPALNEEIAGGTVRPVKIRDLAMNIISMNVSTFIFMTSIMENILPGADDKMKEMYIQERRESNVQFILNALRPL